MLLTQSFTIETRLRLFPSQIKYLDWLIEKYNKMLRDAWNLIQTEEVLKIVKKNLYVINYLIEKYQVSYALAASVCKDVNAKYKQAIFLQRQKIKLYESKIIAINNVIEKLKLNINKIEKVKSKSKKIIFVLTNKKKKLFRLQKSCNRFKQKMEVLKYNDSLSIVKIAHGGKEIFKERFKIDPKDTNALNSWYKRYVNARDKKVTFSGSDKHVGGNYLMHIRYSKKTDTFSIILDKEKQCCKNANEFIYFKNVEFKYMKEELIKILNEHELKQKRYSINCMIIREEEKYYLQVALPLSIDKYNTSSKNGTIGLDYNVGFIELSEIDNCGNLVCQKHYDLPNHKNGKVGDLELQTALNNIVKYCLDRKKDLVIEDLDFTHRKSIAVKKENKINNQILNSIDSSKYLKYATNVAFRYKVKLIKVNPYNTSKIGKEKYSFAKKLNVHQAASFVIARRGRGFKD